MRINFQKWPIGGTQADGREGIVLGLSISVTSQQPMGDQFFQPY